MACKCEADLFVPTAAGLSFLIIFATGLSRAESPASQCLPGNSFDAAPYAFKDVELDGKSMALRWAEPRKVRRVVVDFDGRPPSSEKVKLQYWHGTWDGKPDPIRAETGAGGAGWDRMDDWTNGQWRDADAKLDAKDGVWTFTFNPTGDKEFTGIGQAGVGYRKTLKVRLLSEEPLPASAGLQAFTDAVCQPLKVRVMFGKPAEPRISVDKDDAGTIEMFNGAAVSTGPLGSAKVGAAHSWTLPAGAEGGLELDLVMAVDPVDPRYDRTIVTLRSRQRPFSFAADEVARGDRILVDDLGVLVVRADDGITLEACRQARKELPGRTVYDRVFDEPEQTWQRAWNDMPLKRPLYFVHGLPGNRNAMHQLPNGSLRITGRPEWFKVPRSPKDTDRKLWDGEILHVDFGLPQGGSEARRELKEGYLPLLRTWWQDGDVHYEQCTILDKLDGNLETVALDDPTVLLVRIRMVNTSRDAGGKARLLFSTTDKKPETLVLRNDRLFAQDGEKERFRFLVTSGGKGAVSQEGASVRWTMELGPGQAHEVYCLIPSVTLTKEAEIAALRERDFDADSKRICEYWRAITARGAQIETPEPAINDFYKSHVRHLLVNCYKEVGSDRLHAHVGTFHYGVFPDESCMMISDLDRRGYHDEARRCLDSFLEYQGTVQMPGNFKSKEGLFYGSGGHDTGGYNKSHGWVMWNMAEHWKNTRDRAWMEKAAPKLVASCDWVTRERRATMKTNAGGSRPIEYGWLPTGSLEDVTDYWYWMVTNACTVWGFDALAAALADFGHPEAARLQADAKAYHEDFMQAMEEARIRCPVVRLRDGTYVPKYPSRLYERGRCHGWLRETLEGSIHLMITGLIQPNSPEAGWIIKDFEDNLYISDTYGYAIPAFNTFWFSRGGFSMQANLLGGPLAYLCRDEIKHYVRTYFNSLASAYYPEIRMCNEHSLPELGYPAGDHFKSSDEAQSTYWLRLMFVHEAGEDLILGQAIPRCWLADGRSVGIERAASHFGTLSFRLTSEIGQGRIKAVVDPPMRNPPKNIYLRFRHPDGKPIKSVTIAGQAYDKFDVAKEWVILPGSMPGSLEIVASY
ncbi:MAG: hypothetical protein QUV05_05250 [Phycisphaerae bacterium]|nr:hypothetical protein [Phycisphaerae bacterium]